MSSSTDLGGSSSSRRRLLVPSRHRASVSVLAALSLLVTTALVGTGVAAARSTTKPPPIPDCYYTGSGYGSCEGYVIPGGGTVVPLTVANKTDEFKLKGPAPLQWTKPVACGDLGCVYNHLDWFVGGGTVVSGCQVNESTCSVIVPPGGTSWVPIYVRQNNDPCLNGKRNHGPYARCR